MPTEQDAGNSLTTCSVHAFEEISSEALARFEEERAAYPGLAAGTEGTAEVLRAV
jgi:hypothetical protein